MPLYLKQILNNYSAITAPTITDDNSFGYGNGSIWFDTLTSFTYLLVDDSVGSAVWKLI